MPEAFVYEILNNTPRPQLLSPKSYTLTLGVTTSGRRHVPWEHWTQTNYSLTRQWEEVPVHSRNDITKTSLINS